MNDSDNQVDLPLFSSSADKLLVLCEEVMRATPDSAKRFIEPAPGVLARAKSKQHNIIFGRRGSGKSSLLRKVAADLTVDRRPLAFVDMETFKGHSYPDVLISVLIKSLHEFRKWLETAATTPASKTSLWKRLFGTTPTRPPFNRQKTASVTAKLSQLISDLESQLAAPESAAIVTKDSKHHEKGNKMSGTGTVSAPHVQIAASGQKEETLGESSEEQRTYVSHKVEYLHQRIIEFQNFFQELSTLSDGPSFLILDDLYHIRREDQARVIDYFHRVAKGHGMWLKVGTIKHRSEWYRHSDPPIGMKLGDDAKEINLDISLEKFETLRQFLRTILGSLLAETPPLGWRDMINPTALDRLIIASGGVTRDFIGIFSNSITQARNRGAQHYRGPKVGAEDVNLATGDYDSLKREEFKLDSAEDRATLEHAFEDLTSFCTLKSKCNVFLIPQKLTGQVRESIDQLIDLRLVHPVKSRVTLKAGAVGELFEAYMLDLSQYIGARKVRDFAIVDLSASGKDEEIRKASLIYARAE